MNKLKLCVLTGLPVIMMVLGAAPQAQAVDDVHMIIDQRLWNYSSDLRNKIDRYIDDVEARFPVHIIKHRMQNFNDFSPEQMRDFLKTQWQAGMKGSILVGAIPYAKFQISTPVDGIKGKGIFSMFYEDLDGNFEDNWTGTVPDDPNDPNAVRGPDGYYDWHSWGPDWTGGTPEPNAYSNNYPNGATYCLEAWTCWMRPPMKASYDPNVSGSYADYGHQAEWLCKFLDKTHNYYTQYHDLVQHRGIAAYNDDFDGAPWEGNQFKEVHPSFQRMFGDDSIIALGVTEEENDKARAPEITAALENGTYKIFDIRTHGTRRHLGWDEGQYMWYDIKNLGEPYDPNDPNTLQGPLMTHMFACHGGDFPQAEQNAADPNTPYEENTAISFLSSDMITQAVSGSTCTYPNENYKKLLYEALEGGVNYLGEAWFQYISDNNSPECLSWRTRAYQDDLDRIYKVVFPLNLFGNPFLYVDTLHQVLPEPASVTALAAGAAALTLRRRRKRKTAT